MAGKVNAPEASRASDRREGKVATALEAKATWVAQAPKQLAFRSPEKRELG